MLVAALVPLAFAAMPAFAAPVSPNTVPTLSCSRIAQTTNLVLEDGAGAQLALGIKNQHVAEPDVGGAKNISFDFWRCDSEFTGWRSNQLLAYGQLRVSNTNQCVVTDHRNTSDSESRFLLADIVGERTVCPKVMRET